MKEYNKVVIQHEEAGERCWICPICGEINYLCLADEPGMVDDCLTCGEYVLLTEE